MSGSIRRWMILGALASGSLLFTACRPQPAAPEEFMTGERVAEPPYEGDATGGAGFRDPTIPPETGEEPGLPPRQPGLAPPQEPGIQQRPGVPPPPGTPRQPGVPPQPEIQRPGVPQQPGVSPEPGAQPGTGGAGEDFGVPQERGTTGQGVTGGDIEGVPGRSPGVPTERGGVRGPGIPEPEVQPRDVEPTPQPRR